MTSMNNRYFRQLPASLAAATTPRSRLPNDAAPLITATDGFVDELVVNGEVDIATQPLDELMALAGIRVLRARHSRNVHS